MRSSSEMMNALPQFALLSFSDHTRRRRRNNQNCQFRIVAVDQLVGGGGGGACQNHRYQKKQLLCGSGGRLHPTHQDAGGGLTDDRMQT
jgi:hypothetical protein